MKRILLDECIPRPLAQYLPDYNVRTAPQMGWARMANGALLKLAEVEFEVFITVDKDFGMSKVYVPPRSDSSFCALGAIVWKTCCRSYPTS